MKKKKTIKRKFTTEAGEGEGNLDVKCRKVVDGKGEKVRERRVSEAGQSEGCGIVLGCTDMMSCSRAGPTNQAPEASDACIEE